MRAISNTLKAAQKRATVDQLRKVALTYNSNSYTYERDRVKEIAHTEEHFRSMAYVLLDNADKSLNDIDFQGYKGVLSYGAKTKKGDEYSATAPLWVVSNELVSSQGALYCLLGLGGMFNMLGEDKASELYAPDTDNTDTVKDIIDAVLGATLTCFDWCDAITVVYDSEDNLIDSFQPKDYFRVAEGETRLSSLKRLLSWTNCVARPENDEKIHIFVPKKNTSTAWQATTAYSLNDMVIPTTPNEYVYVCTTAGTSGSSEPTWATGIGDVVTDGATLEWTVAYDYEYSLKKSGFHTFFNKSYRKRIVLPNYITVHSHSEHSPQYTGSASISQPIEKRASKTLRLTSNQQAQDIATAMLEREKIDSERGSGSVPMNVGAEIYDFTKVTDERQDDYRNGNLGYIKRTSTTTPEYKMDMRFGDIAKLTAGLMPQGLISTAGGIDWGTLSNVLGQLIEAVGVLAENQSIIDARLDILEAMEDSLLVEGVIKRLHVTERLRIPEGTDMYDA